MEYQYPIHKHPVYDTDKHFIIDPISRTVANHELKKTSLIQYDHNSERFSFQVDRYIEGHDMSLCNKVEIHYTNTDSSSRSQHADVYEVDDLTVSELSSDTIVFTWLISENATQYKGSLSFLVAFACEEEGIVTYRWQSGINTSVSIAPGMNNGQAVTEGYPDILAQWKADLFSRNYSYEGAVENGFVGTEEEWYDVLLDWAKNTLIWDLKQNTLGWVTEADIDLMFDGTYEGVEDDTPEGYTPSFNVTVNNETLIIEEEKEVEGSDV